MPKINRYKIKQFTINSELVSENKAIMTATTQYPSIEGEKTIGAGVINEFYRASALKQQKYVDEQILAPSVEDYNLALEADISPYQWISDFLITYNNAPILSISGRSYQYTSGAHGITMMTSQTWLVATGEQIKLKKLFSHNDNYEKLIKSEIIRQIKKQIAEGNDYYFDNYEELVNEKFNPENFYLVENPGSIVFYFQQYDIAPYSSGILSFSIPLE